MDEFKDFLGILISFLSIMHVSQQQGNPVSQKESSIMGPYVNEAPVSQNHAWKYPTIPTKYGTRTSKLLFGLKFLITNQNANPTKIEIRIAKT